MIILRASGDRRHGRSGARETWRTFDPDNRADTMGRGFHALEALNEEKLSPGAGFLPDLPEPVEILTYVRTGALTYQGASGGLCRMGAGEFLRTCARRGTARRKLNGFPGHHTQLFQSCITPGGKDFKPRDEQRRFVVAERRGNLRLIASPDGRDGSLRIHQDVRMYSSLMDSGTHLVHELLPGRSAWLHVVAGRALLLEHGLRAGDSAGLTNEAAVSMTAQEASEILLFDLA